MHFFGYEAQGVVHKNRLFLLTAIAVSIGILLSLSRFLVPVSVWSQVSTSTTTFVLTTTFTLTNTVEPISTVGVTLTSIVSITAIPILSPTVTPTFTPTMTPTVTPTLTHLPSPTPTWEPIPGIYVPFDFENGPQGWTGTGLWHLTSRRAAQSSPLQSWWYGREDTVTYETGAVTSGTLTSPLIAPMFQTVPELYVMFWWEIESVNPQANDLIKLQISNDYGATWETLASLNPVSNPASGAPGIPYTSGGFNQPGIWTGVGPIDLSNYVGQIILLRLTFNSVTADENGFEGLYIDDVYIHSHSISPPSPTWTPAPPPTTVPTKAPTAKVEPPIPTAIPTPPIPALLPETGEIYPLYTPFVGSVLIVTLLVVFIIIERSKQK